MNSASRRDSINNGYSSSPSSSVQMNTAPIPCLSNNTIGIGVGVGGTNNNNNNNTIGNNVIVGNHAPALGGGSSGSGRDELFERVGMKLAGTSYGYGGGNNINLPLKPSSCEGSAGSGSDLSGNNGNHANPFPDGNHANQIMLQQIMCQQQVHHQQQQQQQAFCPSPISPVASGGDILAQSALALGVDPVKKSPSPLEILLGAVQAGNSGVVASAQQGATLSNNGSGGIKNNNEIATGPNNNCSPPITSSGGLSLSATIANTLGANPRPNAFHGKGSFPLNLTLMLESVEAMNLSHIVSWLPGGNSFVIHDPDQFLAEVLPKFFKSSKNTKIRSFYRKLNRWGFSIIRGNHHAQLHAAAAATGAGGLSSSLMANTPTKGVWNHPDFYRSRAIEYLKSALETGETGSFLTVTHGANTGSTTQGTNNNAPAASENINEGDAPKESSAARPKKRRSSASPSLTSSTNTTASTSLDLSFFGNNQSQIMAMPVPQRTSRRESEFSMGDDSTPDLSSCTDEFLLSAVGARQQAALSTALAHSQQRVQPPAAYNGMMSNSFTAGVPVPMQVPSASPFASSTLGGAMNNNNKRGRHSVALSSATTDFNYQPVTQSGMTMGRHGGGNNNRRGAASWTAGSTFTQHDFDFPGLSFNPVTGAPGLDMPQEPLGTQQEEMDPLPLTHGNGNVDMMESLISMGMHQHTTHRQPSIQEGGEERDFTPEDAELASFFEKFAESLQK